MDDNKSTYALQKEIERLQKALEEIAKYPVGSMSKFLSVADAYRYTVESMRSIAKQALADEDQPENK